MEKIVTEFIFTPKREDKRPYEQFKKDCKAELFVDNHIDEYFNVALIVQRDGSFKPCKTSFMKGWDSSTGTRCSLL